MKGIFIAFILLFFVASASAQVMYLVFGGAHASSVDYSIKGKGQSTSYKPGFHLGVGCKVPFDNRLFFTPALSYKMMGYKVRFNTPSLPPDLKATDNDTRFHDIDVDILLHFELWKKPSHLFVKAGPSFDFTLWGVEDYNLNTGTHVSRAMKFSVLKGYSRYDVSFVAQLGFENAHGFVISALYEKGLFSMNNEDAGPTIQKYLLGVSLGKYFRFKKS